MVYCYAIGQKQITKVLIGQELLGISLIFLPKIGLETYVSIALLTPFENTPVMLCACVRIKGVFDKNPITEESQGAALDLHYNKASVAVEGSHKSGESEGT